MYFSAFLLWGACLYLFSFRYRVLRFDFCLLFRGFRHPPVVVVQLTPPPPPPPFSVYKETHPNRQLFTIFTYTIICITTVSNFSRVLRSSQEKSKTVVMQFF